MLWTTQPAPDTICDRPQDDESPEGDMVDMEIAAEQDEAGIMDEGKAAHDKATLNSVKGQAIAIGHGLGLLLSPGNEKEALGLFPKVSPLPFLIHLLTGTLN